MQTTNLYYANLLTPDVFMQVDFTGIAASRYKV